MPGQEWRVASQADMEEPGAIEFRVGESEWPFRGILVRWQGKTFAYTNSCAHLGHPLNFNPDGFFTPDKTLLICASHGALFEPDTGVCVAGPCVGAKLQTLKCRVVDDDIYVHAPDSQRE